MRSVIRPRSSRTSSATLPRIVVSDAGPLIGLATIGQLGLLSSLFEEILLPAEVADECCRDPSLPGARVIQSYLEQGTLVTVSPPSEPALDLPASLGLGEGAAIVLALHHRCPLLIDDLLGRRAARGAGVDVIGTGAVLLQAKMLGLIDEVKPLLDLLRGVGYRLSPSLIEALLRRAGEA